MKRRGRAGQALLITVLTIGGAILGVTTIAGLLTVNQIRATTDSQNSAKAIFAADSGIEWVLYSYFNPPKGPLPSPLGNGSTIIATCYDSTGITIVSCDLPGITASAISEGDSLNSARAFYLNLTASTSTYP